MCANSTGAYGALRVDWEPRPIDVTGDGFDMTLKDVQPYMEFYRGEVEAHADWFLATFVLLIVFYSIVLLLSCKAC